MKLNIKLPGTNINDSADTTNITPAQLNTIENNSCEEIILNQTLDYVKNRQDVLMMCISKLRSKGVLFLSGKDIIEISKKIITGELTIEAVNTLLFSESQSIDYLFRMINMLKNLNMIIEEKRLIDLEYAIKIKKP